MLGPGKGVWSGRGSGPSRAPKTKIDENLCELQLQTVSCVCVCVCAECNLLFVQSFHPSAAPALFSPCLSLSSLPALPPLRYCFSSFLYLHALIVVIEYVRLLWRPQSANPRSICHPMAGILPSPFPLPLPHPVANSLVSCSQLFGTSFS